jgi:hypothetical protein
MWRLPQFATPTTQFQEGRLEMQRIAFAEYISCTVAKLPYHLRYMTNQASDSRHSGIFS